VTAHRHWSRTVTAHRHWSRTVARPCQLPWSAVSVATDDSRVDIVDCSRFVPSGRDSQWTGLAHSTRGSGVRGGHRGIRCWHRLCRGDKDDPTARAEARRAEKVAVLTEAFGAIHELTRATGRAAMPDGTTPRAERVAKADAGPMKRLGDKYSMAATKLRLYGFTDAAKRRTPSATPCPLHGTASEATPTTPPSTSISLTQSTTSPSKPSRRP
jgi:hypothetical protein